MNLSTDGTYATDQVISWKTIAMPTIRANVAQQTACIMAHSCRVRLQRFYFFCTVFKKINQWMILVHPQLLFITVCCLYMTFVSSVSMAHCIVCRVLTSMISLISRRAVRPERYTNLGAAFLHNSRTVRSDSPTKSGPAITPTSYRYTPIRWRSLRQRLMHGQYRRARQRWAVVSPWAVSYRLYSVSSGHRPLRRPIISDESVRRSLRRIAETE